MSVVRITESEANAIISAKSSNTDTLKRKIEIANQSNTEVLTGKHIAAFQAKKAKAAADKKAGQAALVTSLASAFANVRERKQKQKLAIQQFREKRALKLLKKFVKAWKQNKELRSIEALDSTTSVITEEAQQDQATHEGEAPHESSEIVAMTTTEAVE